MVDFEPSDIDIDPDDPDDPRKYYIAGTQVSIVAERIEYLDEYGKLVTESLRDYSKKALRSHFVSLDDFLRIWNSAERKQVIIDELENEGLLLDPLAEEVGKDLDPFDLICHVAFDQPPLTRRERAANVRKRDVFTKYGDQARAVLEALLQKYQDEGVTELDDPRILRITPFDTMGTPIELLNSFGGRDGFEQAVHELQSALYHEVA
jgi:type I restriction enzyme R subunit